MRQNVASMSLCINCSHSARRQRHLIFTILIAEMTALEREQVAKQHFFRLWMLHLFSLGEKCWRAGNQCYKCASPTPPLPWLTWNLSAQQPTQWVTNRISWRNRISKPKQTETKSLHMSKRSDLCSVSRKKGILLFFENFVYLPFIMWKIPWSSIAPASTRVVKLVMLQV